MREEQGVGERTGMTTTEATALAFRVLGVYLLIQMLMYAVVALYGFVTVVLDFVKAGADLDTLSVAAGLTHALILAAMAAVAILVICFSKWLARLVCRREDSPVRFEIDAGEAQAMAISLLGLYFAAYGVTSLISMAINWARLPAPSPGGRALLSPIVREAVRAVVGVGLFLGSRGLTRLWQGLRSPGRGVTSGGDAKPL